MDYFLFSVRIWKEEIFKNLSSEWSPEAFYSKGSKAVFHVPKASSVGVWTDKSECGEKGRNAGFPELPVETMQFSGRFWSFSGHGKGPSDQTIRKLPSFPFTEVSTCVISQVWLTLHDTGISCEGLSPRSFSGKAIPLPSQVSGLPEVHPIP